MSTNNEKIEAQRAAFLHQPIQHWHRHLIGPSELELLLARAHTDHTAEYWMGVATRRGEELAQATKECDALRAQLASLHAICGFTDANKFETRLDREVARVRELEAHLESERATRNHVIAKGVETEAKLRAVTGDLPPHPDTLIAELEAKGLGWSLDHTGNLIEVRVWRWPHVIGRYRPAKVEPLADMLRAAIEDARAQAGKGGA